MNAAGLLTGARKRAGLTQRQLASRAGVAQPAVARIESAAVIPRVDTLDRLLAACGETLESRLRLGRGVDRSSIRALLDLSPAQRVRLAVEEARNLDLVAVGRAPRPGEQQA
jgi:transcriptional regulator with XRE-family HTH domain